jgi:hypothetical protein
MGEKEVGISGKGWEGTWVDSDGTVAVVNVLEGDRGLIRVAGLDEAEGQLALNQSNVYLRSSSGWLFGSIEKDREDPLSPDRYLWCRIKKEGDLIVIWAPNEELFRRLVDEGALPGKTYDRGVELGNLETRHYRLITSEERGVLFRWDQPLFFRKIKN